MFFRKKTYIFALRKKKSLKKTILFESTYIIIRKLIRKKIKIMITTVNNIIAKTNATFATSSKWSDSVVSNFDAGVKQQLYGDMEV